MGNRNEQPPRAQNKNPFSGVCLSGRWECIASQSPKQKPLFRGLSELSMGVHSLPEPKIKTPFQGFV